MILKQISKGDNQYLKPEALKSLYRSPGNKKKQLQVSGFLWVHLDSSSTIKLTAMI
jgi:hypothetical protein